MIKLSQTVSDRHNRPIRIMNDKLLNNRNMMIQKLIIYMGNIQKFHVNMQDQTGPVLKKSDTEELYFDRSDRL